MKICQTFIKKKCANHYQLPPQQTLEEYLINFMHTFEFIIFIYRCRNAEEVAVHFSCVEYGNHSHITGFGSQIIYNNFRHFFFSSVISCIREMRARSQNTSNYCVNIQHVENSNLCRHHNWWHYKRNFIFIWLLNRIHIQQLHCKDCKIVISPIKSPEPTHRMPILNWISIVVYTSLFSVFNSM